MARMVRKQIVLDAEQERALAERARLLGVSQSELVREAVAAMLSGAARPGQDRVWDELFSVMRGEGLAVKPGSGGRRWTREAIHER